MNPYIRFSARYALPVLFLFTLVRCQPIDQEDLSAVNSSASSLARARLAAANDASILDGYTDKVAYSPGEPVQVFINAREVVNKAVIGLYDVNGNLVAQVKGSIKPQSPNPTLPYQNGFGYQPSFTFVVPDGLRSGVYQFPGPIPFIVRKNPNRHTTNKIVAVYPSNTEAAYNESGGKSMYSPDRAQTVSYLRPRSIQSFITAFLSWDREENLGIDFISDQDMDNYSLIDGYKVIMPFGHSEYWSEKARRNFDRFVNQGGAALVMSGNTLWWRITYSPDGTQMNCTRDFTIDRWDNPGLNYPIAPSIGAYFTIGGYGFARPDYPNPKGGNGYIVVAPNSPLLDGTNLKKGSLIQVPTDEYDGVPLTFPAKAKYPTWTDNSANFYKRELIGYDYAIDVNENQGQPVYGTFIAFQKSPTSGPVINMASTDWCSGRGLGGPSGALIKKITLNALNLLKKGKSPFSSKAATAGLIESD